jgi:hypothetical protein
MRSSRRSFAGTGPGSSASRARFRAGAAGAAALGVVAVSSLSYAVASGGSSRAPQAVTRHAVVTHAPGNATPASTFAEGVTVLPSAQESHG